MKISQLLQSDLIGDHAIIEVWRKPFSAPCWQRAGRWERVFEGYKDENSILEFKENDITEFFYKSCPETFSIFL